MKKILIVLLLFTAHQAPAQLWKADLDEAMKAASSTNRRILLFFSVAEHCDSCTSLQKNVFDTEEFVNFAQNKYELVKLDFSNNQTEPSEDEIQRNLLIIEKYNKDGFFPLVVVIGKDGKVFGKTGPYEGQGVAEYIRMLNSI